MEKQGKNDPAFFVDTKLKLQKNDVGIFARTFFFVPRFSPYYMSKKNERNKRNEKKIRQGKPQNKRALQNMDFWNPHMVYIFDWIG